jgi:hypothetical protein
MSKAPAKKGFREGGIVRPEEAKAKDKAKDGNPFAQGFAKGAKNKLAPPFKKKGK